jgi:hypothetical protein
MVARFLVRGKLPSSNARACWHDGWVSHFDLCIIGTGSGNSIIDERFDHLNIALVEMGTFGGTCLNVGCIPSKMFVHPADLAASTVQATRLGVDLHLRRSSGGKSEIASSAGLTPRRPKAVPTASGVTTSLFLTAEHASWARASWMSGRPSRLPPTGW